MPEKLGFLGILIKSTVLFTIFGGFYFIKNSIKNRREKKQQAKYVVGSAGFTELMLSAKDGDIEACHRLIESGANINHQDDKGATALLYAVLAAKEDIVQLLLNKGADPQIPTNKGLTALAFAENNKLDKLIAILRDSYSIK